MYTQEAALAAGNSSVLAPSSSSSSATSTKASAPSAAPAKTSWAATAAGLASHAGTSDSSHSASPSPALGISTSSENSGKTKPEEVAPQSATATVQPTRILTKPIATPVPPAAESLAGSTLAPNASSTAGSASSANPSQTVNPWNTFQYNAYNGFGKCVVFPVPSSSYHVSIWNKIMSTSSADLTLNPFSGITNIPITELLELTLPAVDSVAQLPMWPKPLSYYVHGPTVPLNGSSAMHGAGPNMAPMPQQSALNAHMMTMGGGRLPPTAPPTNSPAVNPGMKPMTSSAPSMGIVPPANQTPISALQQVLPGVKLQYASSANPRPTNPQ